MTSVDREQPAGRAGGALLRLCRVSKSFGGVQALTEVDFELRRGEVHAIAGENGAGKSTFVKMIAGVYPPDAGKIQLKGVDYLALTPQIARGNGVSVVHQEFNLLPDLTVGENIFLGALPAGPLGTISPKRIVTEAGQILNRLGSRLDPRRLVGDLTVVEQQLVEIAKALAIDAEVIVLDEPSTVLSGDELKVLHDVVRRLRDENRGVIYISHRLHEVFDLADRVTVFKDGVRVTTCRTDELDADELIRKMVGRPLVEVFPHRHPELGEVALEVIALGVHAKIDDVSLRLRRGEIVGVAGLGGSGRTTLLRALVGLERVATGRILLEGRQAPRSPGSCARAGLVMVPEDRKAHGIMAGQSMTFNLSVASLRMLGRLGMLSVGAERALADKLIARFGIRPNAPRTPIENLSGGNQQKVVLARWLAHSPKVVLLDEPTRGVDVGAKAEIYALIEDLSRTGVAVLFASSELPELIGTCDRILVMCEGRLVADIASANATEEAILRAATSGAGADAGLAEQAARQAQAP